MVRVVDGDLVVTGDGQADQVAIVQSVQDGQPVAGRYFVAGQNGTTINGQTNGQLFQNVRRDIVVNLNGNNDRLNVGNGIDGDFFAPRDLPINTGTGRRNSFSRSWSCKGPATGSVRICNKPLASFSAILLAANGLLQGWPQD